MLRICRHLAVIALAASLAGCGQTLTVRAYPDFHRPGLDRVAVAEFESQSLDPRAGRYVARRLSEQLSANGTYDVVSPDVLAGRLWETPRWGRAAPAADALGGMDDLDAVIVGAVTAFGSGEALVPDVRHGYVTGGYGWGYPYWGAGYRWPVVTYRRYAQAYVEARASLVELPGGAVLSESAGLLGERVRSVDSPRTSEELIRSATDRLVRRLVERFAVVSRDVQVDPGKVLRPARRTAAGRPAFTDDFRVGEGPLLVVVSLPAEAERNEFTLGLHREGGGDALAERSFTWNEGDVSRRFELPLPQGAAADVAGDYEVRLSSGLGAPIVRGFEIEP